MKHHPELARLLTEANDTTNFIAYDATSTQSKGQKDHSNCVLRAISVACDTSMDGLKAHFKKQGARKYGEGVFPKDYEPVIKDHNGTKVWSKKFGGTAISLSGILKAYPKGRFILSMRRHLVALIDGKVIDLGGLDINTTNRVWLRDKAQWYTYKRVDSPVFKVWQVS